MSHPQTILDQTASGSVALLPIGEHSGPLRISRPVIADGQGRTLITADKGPTVIVTAPGVVLRRLRIEAGGAEATASASRDPDAMAAIDVRSGGEVRLEEVEVRGEIRGVPGESGVWRLPPRLDLGELPTRKPHEFLIELHVPANVELRSRIVGLSFDPPRLAPGLGRTRLRIDPIDVDDAFLGGRIEVVSASGAIRVIWLVARFRNHPKAATQLPAGAWIWRPSDRSRFVDASSSPSAGA